MPEDKVHAILNKLIVSGLVVVAKGWPEGGQLYRITTAGLNHPQRKHATRKARPPRLAVELDRVCRVLSTIADFPGMRIRDVGEAVSIPHQSINALMQYLKRRQLVRKMGEERSAPYCLTDYGRLPWQK